MAKLLFILSGSIAAYKAGDVISQLVQRGLHVRTVATPSALRFIGAATLEGLTREPVRTDLFAPGGALEHIDLDRWADALVVCPATGNTLNRFAAGLADDLAGALFLAHDRSKPCLVAPAMNPEMWSHPATVASIERLRQWGVQFLPMGTGRTACGEVGEGRLAEPALIVDGIESALYRPTRKLRVLITSGGTEEPIDGVRVLSNTSTGRTGALIAEYFFRRGHEVTLLRARRAMAQSRVREEIFSSFADLDRALTRLLATNDYDAIVHAAAVSDFAIKSVVIDGLERQPAFEKIPTTANVSLQLVPQPKLVDRLRERSRNSRVRIVAFKLTREADAAAAQRSVAELFAHSPADWVVHNDLLHDAGGENFPATIYQRGAPATFDCPNRAALPEMLETILSASLAAQ